MTEIENAADKIEYLVEEYSDMLLRIALHHTNNINDAQDTVQSVFLKYMQKKPSFNDKNHEKAWFIRVAINHCKDIKNSAWNKKTICLEEYMAHSDDCGYDENKHEIIPLIKKLPEKYRNIIYLYYYEGYSTVEISTILNIKQSTAESRLFRARKHLKVLLETIDL